MDWGLFRDGIILSICMLVATFIRSRFVWVQRYYVPSALLGGGIALLVYEFFHLPREMLGAIVYHLLNISFISISLRATHTSSSFKNIARNSASIFFQYALQILLGLGITYFFIYTLMPDLSLGFGVLLPLGYALGAGTAYSITSTWESFPDAANLALFIASVGYIIACCIGTLLIHRERKRQKALQENSGTHSSFPSSTNSLLQALDKESSANKGWRDNAVIDKLALHISIILLVYGLTWIILRGAEALLVPLGDEAASIARSLWGVAFLFSSLMATFVRFCLGKRRGDMLLDTHMLNRINGTAIDYMLCAAIAAIAFHALGKYWLPLSVLTVSGLVLVLISVKWFCSRMYHDHVFARTLMIFGVSTGTLSCALGLLRIIDPDFMLPVANDYMHSMKMNFFLAMPLILIINLPQKTSATGDMKPMYITLAVALLYALLCLLALFILGNRRKVRPL